LKTAFAEWVSFDGNKVPVKVSVFPERATVSIFEEVADSCESEHKVGSVLAHAYSVVRIVNFKTSVLSEETLFVKQVNLPYPVTFTSWQKALVPFLSPKSLVLMPKPVPVTVTKVPPMLPPVFGLTETKDGVKVKLVILV
jgi:hypothetical protein